MTPPASRPRTVRRSRPASRSLPLRGSPSGGEPPSSSAGTATTPPARTRALAIGIGGTRQRVERMRLPRDDVYGRLDPGDPASAHAYRSGFVSLVDLAPVASAARLEVELIVTLGDGTEASVPAGSIEVEPQLRPPDDTTAPAFPERDGGRVAICMATYEPPADLLRMQLDSHPRADARELGLRDQRRLLDRMSPSRACGSSRTATTASRSPEARSGWASTGTSSGPSRWRLRLRTSSLTATRMIAGIPTSSSGCSGASATPSSSTATRGSSAPRASWSGPPTGRSGATTTRTSPRS